MSNPNIVFADDASQGPRALQQEVAAVVRQLNDGATAILVEDIDLASGANVIAHNLPVAPRAASFTPHASVTWYQTSKPDDLFVYVTASGAVTGDLFIWL